MQTFFQAIGEGASAVISAAILENEKMENNLQLINNQTLFHNVITIGAIAFAAFALFQLSIGCALVSGVLFALRFHVGELLNTRIGKLKALVDPLSPSANQYLHGGNYRFIVLRSPITIDGAHPWRPSH